MVLHAGLSGKAQCEQRMPGYRWSALGAASLYSPPAFVWLGTRQWGHQGRTNFLAGRPGKTLEFELETNSPTDFDEPSVEIRPDHDVSCFVLKPQRLGGHQYKWWRCGAPPMPRIAVCTAPSD